MIHLVIFPVIVKLREVDDSHQQHKAHVRTQFLDSDPTPLSILLFTHALTSVLATLLHNELKQRGSEKKEENLFLCTLNRHLWPWCLLKIFNYDRGKVFSPGDVF